MDLTTLVVWLLVGLVAGWLASKVVGGGFGLVGDIIVGLVGSVIGGVLFRSLGASSPLAGWPGVILVAFVGAVLLLVVLRVAAGSRRRS